eukprot:5776037-Prymnesium_polylepis.1
MNGSRMYVSTEIEHRMAIRKIACIRMPGSSAQNCLESRGCWSTGRSQMAAIKPSTRGLQNLSSGLSQDLPDQH